MHRAPRPLREVERLRQPPQIWSPPDGETRSSTSGRSAPSTGPAACAPASSDRFDRPPRPLDAITAPDGAVGVASTTSVTRHGRTTSQSKDAVCKRDAVIVWLSGAFGVGKSSAAAVVRCTLRESIPFDLELVGFLLREMVTVPTDDFQDLPLWRSLVVEVGAAIHAEAQPLIMPMTLLREDYADENQLVKRIVDGPTTTYRRSTSGHDAGASITSASTERRLPGSPPQPTRSWTPLI